MKMSDRLQDSIWKVNTPKPWCILSTYTSKRQWSFKGTHWSMQLCLWRFGYCISSKETSNCVQRHNTLYTSFCIYWGWACRLIGYQVRENAWEKHITVAAFKSLHQIPWAIGQWRSKWLHDSYFSSTKKLATKHNADTLFGYGQLCECGSKRLPHKTPNEGGLEDHTRERRQVRVISDDVEERFNSESTRLVID